MGRWVLLQVGHPAFSFHLSESPCALCGGWELRAVSLWWKGSDKRHSSLWCGKQGLLEQVLNGSKRFSEGETVCLNGSFLPSVLVRLWIETAALEHE